MMQANPDSPSSEPGSPAEITASARAWLAAWGDEVAGVQLDTARRRFSPDVVAFGTYAQHPLRGLDTLYDDQWSNVWHTIENFSFDVDNSVVLPSADGLQAVIVAPWNSTKRDADGVAQPRPGRTTVVLARDGVDAPWLGIHTHFSLVPTPS